MSDPKVARGEVSGERPDLSQASEAGDGLGLLTREELATALKVSLRTVDRMLAEGEIMPVRLRGKLVRFYLPDVVRQLVATALTRKRGPGRENGSGAGNAKGEV
jgi:excisionase family DNA binding protein